MADSTTPDSTPPRETIRISVQGNIQGVNYRRWLQGEALSREISGWVRNRTDGSVEAVLHGEPRIISDMLRACRHGPELARVDSVHSEPADYDGLEGFRIVDTV